MAKNILLKILKCGEKSKNAMQENQIESKIDYVVKSIIFYMKPNKILIFKNLNSFLSVWGLISPETFLMKLINI